MSRLLTRNDPLDTGAPAFRLRHAVEVLAEDFDEVTVIAAQPNRYADAGCAPSRECHGNVGVQLGGRIAQWESLLKQAQVTPQ